MSAEKKLRVFFLLIFRILFVYRFLASAKNEADKVTEDDKPSTKIKVLTSANLIDF